MKAIVHRFLNFTFYILTFNFLRSSSLIFPFHIYHLSTNLKLKTQHSTLNASPTRQQRPIIFYSFSLLLITIHHPRAKSIENQASRIEYPVIYVPIRHPFTSVENIRQISLFMQNKPNFQKGQNERKHIFYRGL